ncbi:MAG: hypothetical protein NTW11_03425 [Candidatus Staskawiczbacteria bacterium]|nr:hypothetical protein [Candidatus Staskawiczbacteria bacterium]
MTKSFLSNKNFQEFITKLGINKEQEKFLLDGLPKMDREERLELLAVLKNVFLLNQERDKAIKKVRELLVEK